ncbi:hypothetical protein O2N63_06150 [Aliiroseovarius sp. KMU-50]|uniref:Uncharacterized protein n=1 Tax=Aliiroseovarius salicola TaxID=3009082 RepID=A0ABT4VZI2_9RHOB|nr:hypothetical protein [Aliiroseovarius sp. KMU-50]MDA5093667.1 hypothetical protein [Aliiroseovarius sp. KMU-50]
MLKWLSLILVLVLVTPVYAEETGTLTGSLDNENTVLDLIASQSDHRGDENFGSVSMVFSADGAAGLKMLFIGFEWRDGSAAVPDIRIVADDRSMYFPREDEDFLLEIDGASKSGEFLTVKGRLRFIADHSKDFGRTRDPSNSHTLEGSFEATIGPV